MRVCLLSAGKGSRAPTFPGLHKALLSLGNRAVISRIITKFPKNTTFVVALGSNSHQLMSYLDYAHPRVNFLYQDVKNFDGIGSGPGKSLLSCKHLLNEPFIFTSIDTLVDYIPDLKENWIGVANSAD